MSTPDRDEDQVREMLLVLDPGDVSVPSAADVMTEGRAIRVRRGRLRVLAVACAGMLVAGGVVELHTVTATSAAPAPLAPSPADGLSFTFAPVTTSGAPAPVTGPQMADTVLLVSQRLKAMGVQGATVSLRVVGDVQDVLIKVPESAEAEVAAATATGRLAFRAVLGTADPGPGPVSQPPSQPTGLPVVTGGGSQVSLATVPAGLLQRFDDLDCTKPVDRTAVPEDPAGQLTVACAEDGSAKYLLDSSQLGNAGVEKAASRQQAAAGGFGPEWVLDLSFTPAGAATFGALTQALLERIGPQNQFALVIDGLVQSAPAVQAVLTDQATLSGGTPPFTQRAATDLAAVLGTGPLPVTLKSTTGVQPPTSSPGAAG